MTAHQGSPKTVRLAATPGRPRDQTHPLIRSQRALEAKFGRLRTRLGAPKAITAMAHHLARLRYRMLKFGKAYVDKGSQHYQAKYRLHKMKWLQKQASALNFQLIPTEAIAP